MPVPKVTDGELNILNLLWAQGALPASEIVRQLSASIRWNRNTTYTFINRLVDKGVVRRTDPNYVCEALYTRDEVGVSEAQSFLERMYDGSVSRLVASFLSRDAVSDDDLTQLKQLIEDSDKGETGGAS